MQVKKADSRQMPTPFPDVQPEKTKDQRSAEEPHAAESMFLKEVELHAPEIVNILARHVDRGFIEDLGLPPADEAASKTAPTDHDPSRGNPVDAIAGDLARLVVDSLFAPTGRTTVQQYTTGIPSLDLDDQYDTIRYQVQKWFDEVLPNRYMHFFWMGRFQAMMLGLDYDLITLVRNEVMGFEPAFSLRRILGPEEFERLARPLHDQTAAFYKALGYHEQPWTNVPPGAEVEWEGKHVTVWDLYSLAFFSLVDAALPAHVLSHPKVYEATYFEQVPSPIFGDGGDG